MPAAFETSRLSLVDRGFVYAIAHIRGGKEGGYRWYTQGKREHKMNSFLDFIASAAGLVDAGYTSPGRIAILGGSAGGMLVGATLNLAPPDLLGAAVAEVPFVDVLNTMLDADLPLTPPEWPEWGNPIGDPDAYDYIRSYSPYDNVEPRHYPPLLATAGLTDPRVTYWEPAKWVARLRATKIGDAPILLRTRMGAGHAGASGRFDHLKELAEVYAFLLQAIPVAS
jgi:oligopeptidase B